MSGITTGNSSIPTSSVRTGPLECNYENNCSNLYKAIEEATSESSWTAISNFLDTGYWRGDVFADKVSPAQQSRTWVIRLLKDCATVRRQLPLHLAITRGAPLSVVSRLIKLYPRAVHVADDRGLLPVQLALRHGAVNDTIMECALRARSKEQTRLASSKASLPEKYPDVELVLEEGSVLQAKSQSESPSERMTCADKLRTHHMRRMRRLRQSTNDVMAPNTPRKDGFKHKEFSPFRPFRRSRTARKAVVDKLLTEPSGSLSISCETDDFLSSMSSTSSSISLQQNDFDIEEILPLVEELVTAREAERANDILKEESIGSNSFCKEAPTASISISKASAPVSIVSTIFISCLSRASCVPRSPHCNMCFDNKIDGSESLGVPSIQSSEEDPSLPGYIYAPVAERSSPVTVDMLEKEPTLSHCSDAYW